MKHLNARVSR